MSEKERKSRKKASNASSRWMTFAEVAAHYCVSVTTVREGAGVFARLRRVQLTDKCVVVVRSDVDRLDREMERAAVALAPEVVSLDEARKTA